MFIRTVICTVHYRNRSQFGIIGGNVQFPHLPSKKLLSKHVHTSEEACTAWEQLENQVEAQVQVSGTGALALKATFRSEAPLL